MIKRLFKKGIVFYMVLATIIIVVLLSIAILTMTLSQSRLTHHQAGRIQAYYAAQAGMVYTYERLRQGLWTSGSCTDAVPCYINDTEFPKTIISFDADPTHKVRVVFCPSATYCPNVNRNCTTPAGINFCIYITSLYTYTP
ncbi:hypothetical protein EPO66_05590 [bacterium]|nr:MAG: hypothetical protein EPO66_05590 [bacterium]